MKKFFKYALLALVGVIVVGTFVFLYQKSAPKAEEYEIVTAEMGSIEQTAVATGKIEPRNEIEIKPQISGIIAELNKQAGDVVKKGEVIARVRVIPDMSSLNAAESRLRIAELNGAQAEIDHSRNERLNAKELISKAEYEKSLLSVRQAREELQAAKDNLDIIKEGISKSTASMSSTLIRSTIDGLILDVPVKVGNSVIMSNTFNDGTTIAYVADMRDLIFKGNVDETEVGRIAVGIPVKISLGAVSGASLDAVLEYISPKSTTSNGATQFEIKAAIHVPEDVTIRSGYSANAVMGLSTANSILKLPESCVEFQGDSAFVYVQSTGGEDGSFQRTLVKTGLSDGAFIEIKSGIKAGDKVRGKQKIS